MLTLEGVEKSFTAPNGEKTPVLNIPHFSVNAGEQMALVGPSGSGKTTLLHTIAGIILPDRGRVMVRGTNIAALPEAARDRFRADYIGYVFQTFNLLPGFTALENVLLGMTFASGRGDPERARELLDRVQLSHRLGNTPSKLSVGEQQRVAVARALVNRPRLVLADEPTANVDHRRQEEVMRLIREACQEAGAALIVVTHAPQVWEKFERVEKLEAINLAASPTA